MCTYVLSEECSSFLQTIMLSLASPRLKFRGEVSKGISLPNTNYTNDTQTHTHTHTPSPPGSMPPTHYRSVSVAHVPDAHTHTHSHTHPHPHPQAHTHTPTLTLTPSPPGSMPSLPLTATQCLQLMCQQCSLEVGNGCNNISYSDNFTSICFHSGI